MPATHTLPHSGDRTEHLRPEHHDPVADVAALYPHDTPSAQRLLAQTVVELLADTGRQVVLGDYGGHATAEVAAGRHVLVLVPMADLWDLDAELAVEDDSDPAVWHLLARSASGALLEPGIGGLSCPSVLWAVRAGIDPAVAVWLVEQALADSAIAAVLGDAA